MNDLLSNIGAFSVSSKDNLARVGKLLTAHGTVNTPAFMPVATQASVKGVSSRDLNELGTEIILSNTYHLHIRPGDERIRELGGLHKFLAWDGPILTDSGGFQVYSLAKLRKIDSDGVTFQSHIDGRKVRFTPESVIKIQQNLGVDIMMVLDECPARGGSLEEMRNSIELTLNWARRSLEVDKGKQLIFGIVQGGAFKQFRETAARDISDLPFDGLAIGGVSVGEPTEELWQICKFTASLLPENKPRYLMGVGTPADIVYAVSVGIDLFDCVIPTRAARFGRIYSGISYYNLRNSVFRDDGRALEVGCDCYSCSKYSRAYIAHLMHAGEPLAIQLASIHNLRFYQRLIREIRSAIYTKRYSDLIVKYVNAYAAIKNVSFP